MSSFAEKIFQITSTSFDPEDEIDDDSMPKILSTSEATKTESTSNLRRRNAPLLEDIDQSYAGRKVSSKSLGAAFNRSLSNDPKSDDSGDSKELMDEDSFSSNGGSDDESESIDEGDENDSMDEDDITDFKETLSKSKLREEDGISSDASCSDLEDSENDKEDRMTKHFAQIDVSSEVEKGTAIKNQKELWNRLLESRIKLQKLLVISNKMPQSSSWKSLENDSEVSECITKSSESLKTLHEKLMELNTELIDKNKELKSICSNFEKSDQEEKGKIISMRKRKIESVSDVLEKRFKSLIPYRNSVIQNFDEKTKLSSGKMTQKSFNAFDNSALKQIEMILQDRAKLIKRTQLKRSLYKVIGKPDLSESVESSDAGAASSSKQDMLIKDYDPEIFDDDDFYRQTLKDVIDNKSFGVDSIYVQKQMEIQKQRNKMKRKIDTKASKGRKIRYDVHPKMVNFCAKLQLSFMSENARNEILKGLFV